MSSGNNVRIVVPVPPDADSPNFDVFRRILTQKIEYKKFKHFFKNNKIFF